MVRSMSHRRRKEAFLQVAAKMYDSLEEWYDDHPAATYGEIELEARRQRRALMGRALEILVNGRGTGFQASEVPCPSCGATMDFKAYLPWTVRGLEGDVELERAYYVCPHCAGETFFPPGPPIATAEGSLE